MQVENSQLRLRGIFGHSVSFTIHYNSRARHRIFITKNIDHRDHRTCNTIS